MYARVGSARRGRSFLTEPDARRYARRLPAPAMRHSDQAPQAPETPDDAGYGPPPELADDLITDSDGLTPRPPRSATLKLALIVVAVLLVGGGLLFYRAQHRRTVLTKGLARADALLRLDTAAGYRDAASLLEPLAEMDEIHAASVRAFALGMLSADYRGAALETEAESLLVEPSRAEAVPPYAHLAAAALAIARREAGNATTAAARAGEAPWAQVLHARIAFLAGNPEAALEPAAAAATAGAFPPGLAVHGDALRRLRKDPVSARAAYEAALAASPTQPRAAYGLAKLALAGSAPSGEALAALQRLAQDREDTPANERGRAAVHMAALHLRAGDRAAAAAALDAARLDAPARAWAARAAEVAAGNRGPYRAVSGAPAELLSASDDDPPELSPNPPPPAPEASASKAPVKKAAIAKKRPATKKAPARTRSTAKRTTSRRSTPARGR